MNRLDLSADYGIMGRVQPHSSACFAVVDLLAAEINTIVGGTREGTMHRRVYPIAGLVLLILSLVTGCGSQDPEAYLDRGNAHYEKAEYDQAIAEYDQAIALNSQYAEAYGKRGRAYYVLGNYDQALADYDLAITLNPQYAEAYVNRGMVYHSTGNLDQAIAEYDLAIALDPQSAVAYYYRGFARSRLDDDYGTIADLEKGLELGLDPEFATSAQELIRVTRLTITLQGLPSQETLEALEYLDSLPSLESLEHLDSLPSLDWLDSLGSD